MEHSKLFELKISIGHNLSTLLGPKNKQSQAIPPQKRAVFVFLSACRCRKVEEIA
ncbi:MAG: hypothetical protein IJ511_06040 [Bacteroides sp.]|nr:hypothetical protein [Bacteroides sp.]